jgi:hypothetical protein
LVVHPRNAAGIENSAENESARSRRALSLVFRWV